MEAKGAWEVARYEVDMHETLLEGELSATALRNALTESMVLHARQLCEIFLSRSAEADNVKLSDLVSESEQSEMLKELLSELERAYGDRRTSNSPCWVFNKMLLHPTTQRIDGYNYDSALNRVRPVLKKIVTEIEAKKGSFERRLRP